MRKHLEVGSAAPAYNPRPAQPRLTAPYEDCLRARVMAWPDLSGKRLLRCQIDAFAAAVRVSDTAKAITAYEELTRGFSFELIAYDDLLGEWLFADASGVPMTIDMEPGENGEWLAIEVRMGDRTERARLPLVRCSEGFTLGAPME